MAEAVDVVERNEALVRRFYQEIHNAGNLEATEELVAPDFVEHISLPFPGQPTSGPSAVTWFISRFRMAFPDLQVTIEDMISARDKVTVRTTWSGTHTGEFLGVAPTDKKIRVGGFDIIRVDRGRVVEHWGQVDALGLMAQLGFLPQGDEAFL